MGNNSRWIACPKNIAVPVIKKTFTLNRPTSGEIDITGLGFFRLTVNGKRVTDDLFTPALTDYAARDMRAWGYPLFDTTTHRIYYLHYKIGEFLHDGENVFEITLAPGWWAQNDHVTEGRMSFSEQMVAWFDAKIQTADGEVSVVSDGSELCRASERTYSNLYLGENIDANFRVNDAVFAPVELYDTPDAVFEKQTCLSDGVIRKIQPKLIKTDGNRRIYDCGENITGVAHVTAGGHAGETVTVRYSEEIDANTEPDFDSTGASWAVVRGIPQIQTDVFTLSDEKFDFVPEFVWHGFRYMEVTGDIDAIEVLVIHTRMNVTSTLETPNEGLSFLYDAYKRTMLGNMHNCIPSDCPHRERLGYTGDGQVTARTAMMIFDAKEAYRKWIQDICDCQDVISGHVQHTAPAMGGGGGPGGWGCAIVIVPDEYYHHYGDIEILKKCYPHMKAWMGYLKSHSTKGIVTSEEVGGWCLGDWACIGSVAIPVEYVNTCCMLDSLNRMIRISALLGYTADKKAFEVYRGYVIDAMRQKYYESVSGSWVGGTQGADAFAVWCGLDEDGRTLKNLIKRTKDIGVFDTGFIGTEILSKVLISAGQADLLFDLLNTEKLGGYLYMKRAGATTIWEHLDGEASHNHHMFAAPALHIFDGFLGIGQEDDSVGYEKPVIAPKLPKKLTDIKGSVTLPTGEFSVSATHTENVVRFDITVPVDGVKFIYQGKTTILKKGTSTLCYESSLNRRKK